jgi:hypothetical protein
MTEKSALIEALSPIIDSISTGAPQDGGEAVRLNQAFPIGCDTLVEIKAALVAGKKEGWLTPNGKDGMCWGRLSKATPQTKSLSIDAVYMEHAGPGHTHPSGEYDLCFTVDGNPKFDGHGEGWVVYPPGSWHIPTVTGGAMIILYFLPEGAIRFGSRK